MHLTLLTSYCVRTPQVSRWSIVVDSQHRSGHRRRCVLEGAVGLPLRQQTAPRSARCTTSSCSSRGRIVPEACARHAAGGSRAARDRKGPIVSASGSGAVLTAVRERRAVLASARVCMQSRAQGSRPQHRAQVLCALIVPGRPRSRRCLVLAVRCRVRPLVSATSVRWMNG